MSREALPARRDSETIKFRFGDMRGAYHVTVGRYGDGRMGEVFISTNKIGTTQDNLARDIAILMSLLLQHGCSMELIRDSLTREQNGSPSTVAGATADRLTVEPIYLSSVNREAELRETVREAVREAVREEELSKLERPC